MLFSTWFSFTSQRQKFRYFQTDTSMPYTHKVLQITVGRKQYLTTVWNKCECEVNHSEFFKWFWFFSSKQTNAGCSVYKPQPLPQISWWESKMTFNIWTLQIISIWIDLNSKAARSFKWAAAVSALLLSEFSSMKSQQWFSQERCPKTIYQNCYKPMRLQKPCCFVTLKLWVLPLT